MYSPKYAIETDRDKIDSVIDANPFATLVYSDQEKVQSFHLPLFSKENRLIGHLAKANPAWETLEGSSVLVIFHGPHCYISPEWYGKPGNVPTWNYISVQVRGQVKIHSDEIFLKEALIGLGQKHDAHFDIATNVNDHQNLLAGIVGIEIAITEVFAKFKLAQSKSEHERLNVVKQLEKSLDQNDRLVAKAMLETMATKV
jgi:transcriptional regulator